MGYKKQIADAIKTRIELVTIANGYSKDIKTVSYDTIRLNIQDYQDHELPAVQIIDINKLFTMSFSQSESSWFLALELCMRTTETIGVVKQGDLWDLMENVVRAIMEVPRLGLSFVRHVLPVDEITDLHLQEPNYIATIGLEIKFREPIIAEC